MTTRDEIQQQIEREYEKSRNKIYDGELPYGLLEKFKVGLFMAAYSQHKFNLIKVKEIISKRDDQLTWMEVGMIANFVVEIPWERLFDNLEEALDYNIELSDFMVSYNDMITKKQKELERMRDRLLNLSGINNKTTKFN